MKTPSVVPTPSELTPRPTPAPPDPTLLSRPAPPRELAKPEDDITIDVTGYELDSSAPQPLRDALAELTQPYVGKGKGWEDLVNAKDEITRFMQSQLGLYLGYAYLPDQAPAGGVVKIAILEGRLDQVRLVWNDGLPVEKAVVEAYLRRLVPGSVLTVRDVERVVFLVNDLRGISARFEVEPGSVPGTASLVVTPVAEPRLAAKVDVDVNGSRFIGLERVGGQVAWNSPTGRGDNLSLSLLSSLTGGLQFALAGYTTPLGSDGWRVGTSLSYVKYKLDEDEIPLGRNGTSTTFNGFALYPFVRSRNLNLFALGSIDHKQYDDRQDISGISTRKKVDAITIGATGDFRDAWGGGGINSFDTSLASGRVHYDDGRPSGLTDAENYNKLNVGFTRIQNIVTGQMLGYVSARGQYSFANLDTTEQFHLGGPDGVRAFASGEGSGDSGLILTAELRHLPGAWLGSLARETVFALFFDWGTVQFRHDTAGTSTLRGNSATYGGAGLSVAWARPGKYAFRLSLATPLVGNSEGDQVVRDPRVFAQFSAFF